MGYTPQLLQVHTVGGVRGPHSADTADGGEGYNLQVLTAGKIKRYELMSTLLTVKMDTPAICPHRC